LNDKSVGSHAVEVESNSEVSAFIRAKPGDANAPVVIHLVDWNKPDPFKMKLRKDFFFDSGELSAVLQVPVAYHEPLHDKAERSKDYSALKKEVSLPMRDEGDLIILEIPVLDPWGVLIISKAVTGGK
jgi:hypothetical protein